MNIVPVVADIKMKNNTPKRDLPAGHFWAQRRVTLSLLAFSPNFSITNFST